MRERSRRRIGAIHSLSRPLARPLAAWLTVAALALSLSCASAPSPEALRALDRDLVRLDEPLVQLPALLAVSFPRARVLFVGETHYVEEHQALWGALVPALEPSGYRAFLQEGMAAWAWAVEDYVLGREGELPPEALVAWPGVGGFDARWLQALRSINLARPEAERQSFGYFDINHWREAFAASARLLLRAAGVEASGELQRVLDASADSPAYHEALSELAAALEGGSDFGLDARWRGRLGIMVRDERESACLRERWSDEAREAFMERKVLETLAELGPEERLIVNCGLYHAQLDAALGPNKAYVAERLAARAELAGRVSSLACVVLRGERKVAFMDRSRRAIDLVADADAGSLMRLIGLASGESPGYLPLAAPEWWQERLRVDWSGDPRRSAPGRQFGAILAYPRGSVLHSTLALERAD